MLPQSLPFEVVKNGQSMLNLLGQSAPVKERADAWHMVDFLFSKMDTTGYHHHYSTMESDLLNSLAWDNFFVFGSLGLYCGIIYPIVPLSHSRGRLLWDNGSMG